MALIVFFIGITFGQNFENELFYLSKIKESVKSKRVVSYDRSGGNDGCLTNIKDREKVSILQVEGAGIINHIWIIIALLADELSRNGITFWMFRDGNFYPSVESLIGLFFRNGWDESYNFVSAPLTFSPAGGTSYGDYFAIPFEDGAKVEIENQTGVDIDAFYFNIDYVEIEKLLENTGQFHAWYNNELIEALPEGENEWQTLGEYGTNKTGEDNYIFANIKGKGHFVGVSYYINNPSPMWYGEGDEMIFIDGETLPSIIGTGTEVFFNASWCPKEKFYHLYFGYPRVNEVSGWFGRTHAYRFMITDLVYFDKSLKFTIEHRHNNCLTLDLASVAYCYQENAAPLPKLISKEERKPMPEVGIGVHIWRDAWRKSMGNKRTLWGNEK